MWGCSCGAVCCGGGVRAGPTVGRVSQRNGPAPALAPFPVPGPAPCGLCLVAGGGGWCCCCGAAMHAALSVEACKSGAALIGFCLFVWTLPPSSSSPTVTGRRLGGFPVGRGLWGGERVVGGVLPRISIGTWGLCAHLCLVLVCRGRYGLGGGFFSSSWDQVSAE